MECWDKLKRLGFKVLEDQVSFQNLSHAQVLSAVAFLIERYDPEMAWCAYDSIKYDRDTKIQLRNRLELLNLGHKLPKTAADFKNKRRIIGLLSSLLEMIEGRHGKSVYSQKLPALRRAQDFAHVEKVVPPQRAEESKTEIFSKIDNPFVSKSKIPRSPSEIAHDAESPDGLFASPPSKSSKSYMAPTVASINRTPVKARRHLDDQDFMKSLHKMGPSSDWRSASTPVKESRSTPLRSHAPTPIRRDARSSATNVTPRSIKVQAPRSNLVSESVFASSSPKVSTPLLSRNLAVHEGIQTRPLEGKDKTENSSDECDITRYEDTRVVQVQQIPKNDEGEGVAVPEIQAGPLDETQIKALVKRLRNAFKDIRSSSQDHRVRVNL